MKLGIYSTAAYLLIFAAAVASLVSFLGCCGSAKVNTINLESLFCTIQVLLLDYSLIILLSESFLSDHSLQRHIPFAAVL
jgi:hypothetical protein